MNMNLSRDSSSSNMSNYSMNNGPIQRHASTRTDDLPSFEMDHLERWESIMSNESMHFSDNPSPLGPVKQTNGPDAANRWRRQSPRERMLQQSQQQQADRYHGNTQS